MERMNFHIFIFGIGLRNYLDRTVGGKKMHDNYIVGYSVDVEKKNIVMI